MTRRPAVSRRSIAQLALAAVVVALVVGLLSHLRATAPSRRLEPVAPAAQSQRGGQPTVATCQRTLADRPAQLEGFGPVPEPVGLARSSEVIACPDTFSPSGRGAPAVVFVGEVIGDVLRRDRGAWVLLNDDAYALETGPLPAHAELSGTNTGLAVWLPADRIEVGQLTPGRPGRRGDVVRVEGHIHRADNADGGGLTLRANRATIVAQAVTLEPPLHTRQAVVAAVVLMAALALTAYERRASRPR
ncbi:MAG: hypothetical protein KY462_00455 [Actinobacteria bacterium]|nr:hypothetical protein [Actinomycetota bacterium]